eukprot:94365_1
MAEEKQETVDFTYTIDCTGSMSSYIQQTQADIEKIVDEMGRQFPAFKLRLGCVAYRDWCDKDKRLEYHDFTENIREFKEYVGNLKAFGGGDEAEDVLGGLNCAADLGWNSKLRVLFHICDAPPHNKIYHDISSDDYPNGHSSDPNNYHEMVLNKLKAKNIHLCIAKLQSNCDKMINVFQGYATRIGLTMEERSIKDVSELLNAVKQTLVILTKMRKEFKETEAEIDKISSSLDSLQHESNIFSKAVETKMQSIQGKIESINGTMINVGTMVADTKREYDELKSTHSIVMAYARNITSDDDIEKAEEKVVDLSEKLTTVHKKYN